MVLTWGMVSRLLEAGSMLGGPNCLDRPAGPVMGYPTLLVGKITEDS